MSPPPANKFTHLAGVQVNYSRPPLAPYGTRGVPATWRATVAFQAKLDTAFADLFAVCPLGTPEMIVSAGAWVDKPGMHGEGRAFDLDSIWWKDRTWIANHFPFDKPFYLAVESVMHRHFGVVLNYLYNDDHRDHLHIDDTDAVGLSPVPLQFSPKARSEVNFVNAAHATFPDLTVPGDLATISSWLEFLTIVARRGFATSAPVTKTPLDLLHDLYTIIGAELVGDVRRKTIESALNVFANDDATQTWLSRFR